MKFLRITDVDVSSYDLEKIADRKNIELWLTSKGIYNWGYHFSTNVFEATVEDSFDISILENWGTVEVLPDEPGN